MFNKKYPITDVSILSQSISKFCILAPEIAKTALPGQFINIKIDDTTSPLLRRPFSIHFIKGDEIEIVFGIMGMGTKKLNCKNVGDYLDIIGPLGKPFNINGTEEISILVGGGLGAAPLSLLSKCLEEKGKKVITILGARTRELLLSDKLTKINFASDDGTYGYHGNVIDLLRNILDNLKTEKIKIYGCGPNPMLKALINLVDEKKILCEVSLETTMACGVGICQGCVVEMKKENQKYSLVCKDGPVFCSSQIII
jgi:dihydroorotate dehydrogenase electron transfer subunit